MSILNGKLKATLAAHAKQYLTDIAVISVQVLTKDAYGAQQTTRQPVITTDCRVINARRSYQTALQMAGLAESMEESYRIIVPLNVPLAVNQQITVNGVSYEIVRIEDRNSDSIFASALMQRQR